HEHRRHAERVALDERDQERPRAERSERPGRRHEHRPQRGVAEERSEPEAGAVRLVDLLGPVQIFALGHSEDASLGPRASPGGHAMADTTFTRMQDASREDYQKIGRHSIEFFTGLPDRILRHLELLDSDTGGYAVTRLTHSLQTATRAE